MAKKKTNNLEKTIAIFSIVISIILLAVIILHFLEITSDTGNCIVRSPLPSFIRIIGLGLVLISGIFRYRKPLFQYGNALLIAGILVFLLASTLGPEIIIYECTGPIGI